MIDIERSRFFSISNVYGGFSRKGRIAGLLGLVENIVVFERIESQNGDISDVFNFIRLSVLKSFGAKITAKADSARYKDGCCIDKISS